MAAIHLIHNRGELTAIGQQAIQAARSEAVLKAQYIEERDNLD